MKNIHIIIASNGKNLELAQKAEAEINTQGAKATIIDLVTANFPLYSPLSDTEDTKPSEILTIMETLKQSDGFLILGPEYNGGIPPVLTNFFAWVSRATKNWRECFNGKTVAIGTFSGGGGLYFLQSLRVQLSYLGCNVIGRQLHTNNAKPLNSDSLTAVMKELIK